MQTLEPVGVLGDEIVVNDGAILASNTRQEAAREVSPVGGIVPDRDVKRLLDAGVAGVLTPGASAQDVVSTVRSTIE